MWKNNNPDRDGDHYYSVLSLTGDGMSALRQLFPEGEANEMNSVMFSTSGVHGHYATIEDVEDSLLRPGEDGIDSVTFLVVQPRIVCMRYGNCRPETPEDIAYLKKLRASSFRALATVGMPASA